MDKYFNYKLTFTKKSSLIYISHLDLLRLFQKALRRAGVPIVFSKGFHPIPIIKFERALKLGIESENEKLYLRLNRKVSSRAIKNRLNKKLPEGILILDVIMLDI